MSSFKIMDTKFRILKGGKIGLAMSIALIGGMLTFGSTNAKADWNLISTTSATTAIISLDTAYTYNTSLIGSSSGLLATPGVNSFTYTGNTDTDGNTVSDGYRASIGYGTGATYIDTYIQAPTLDQIAFTATNGTYKVNDGFSNVWVVNNDNLIDIASGTDITGATYGTAKLAIYAGYGAYTSDEDLGAGVDNQTDYQVVSLNQSTLNIHGNNTLNGIVGYSTYNGPSYGRIGTINLLGNDVTFGDTVYATTVNINTGTNNTNINDFRFNGPVDASNLNFNQAASILLNGGLSGNLNYNGNKSIVTLGALQTIGGAVTTTGVNGTLIFQGEGTVVGDIGTGASGSLEEIRLNGTGLVSLNSGLSADVDYVNYQAGTVLAANGGLLMNVDRSNTAMNQVAFHEHDGVLQIGSGSSLIGILGDEVVTTESNNLGTVTMIGGSQTITGNIGSNGHAIKTLNIGGFADGAALGAEDGTNYSITLANGDIYAQSTVLNNNSTTNGSELSMASEYDLYSTVTTADANSGTLKLLGGIQNVTGTVGTNDYRLLEVDSGATGANSTFASDVFAVTLNNTGTGITNLNGNFTGTTLNFAQDGIVNLANNKTITASVTSAANNTGTLTFVENGTMVGDIGTTHSLKLVNIGAVNTANASTVTTDSITATTTAINNDSTLVVRASEGITGNVTSETTGKGTLNLTAGANFVNGDIGTNSVALGTVRAGTTATTTYLNSAANTTTTPAMSYIDTLQYTGNGTVVLNGKNSGNAIGGMKGTVDFGTNLTSIGTLQIGDDVNLTTGSTGIQFADANGATLTFNGSSTINGDMGSLSGADTFKVINGGAATETVTFNNNVYFMNSLNLSNDGIIEIDDGNYARRNSNSATTGAIVTTTTDGLGNLKYKGSTTLYGNIGTTDSMLKSVTFNSASNNVSQNIGNNVYADTVTIGGASGTTAISLVDITGTYDYAGATTMKEYIGGTVANITSNVTLGGNLVIANNTSAINFGTSHVIVGMNHNGLIPGIFTTNNGAMSFTVDTQDITGVNQAASTPIGSGKVTTSTLNMSGNEKIHINYVGSLANNGTYTLIDGTNGTTVNNNVNTIVVGSYNQNENGNVSDNSFSIDTRIATNNAGDLTVYADRTANASYESDELYVQKSETVGHFSNNAAMALASISADGSQTGDMIEVIQKLELDSFGYGNNQENLAIQVQKLAPIVNTSFAQTSIGATKLVTDTVGSRLSDVRGLSSGEAVKDKGVWAKVTGSTASQDKVGQYDGYNLSSGGVVFGIDKELNNGLIIGLAAGYTNTKTEQEDFRDGDKSTTDSYQLSLYGSKTYDKAYVDGSLSYTKHNTDGQRTTAIDRVASYDVDANQLSAKINGGYNFILENEVALTPFASLEYSTIKQNAYKETGAGAINLSVDDATVNRGAAGLGVKISKEIKTEKNTYIPEFKLGANKYFGDDNVEVEAQFEQGNKFVTKGADMTDIMYNAGLGLKTKFTEDTSVSLSTDYERSNDGDFQGINGQLTFRMQF